MKTTSSSTAKKKETSEDIAHKWTTSGGNATITTKPSIGELESRPTDCAVRTDYGGERKGDKFGVRKKILIKGGQD